MRLPTHFSELWRHINNQNWDDRAFELEKAYVSALFSELTYYRIPDFELESAERISVIPCHAFQQMAAGSERVDLEEALIGLDFGQTFFVQRRFAVAIGVVTPRVIFVAIRGTKYLYDWAVNFGIQKFKHTSGASFHSGFFRAVHSCVEAVSEQIYSFVHEMAEPTPIYLTGHSLGGAMAAILNATWRLRLSGEYLADGNIGSKAIAPTSCYTFGMPRYGDVTAVTTLRTPFHFYNDEDIVPTVPPTILGYETCASEFRLDGRSIENTKSRELERFGEWMFSLASGQKLEQHAIELYRSRIGELIGV